MLKGAAHMSYVKSAILHGSEECYLKESVMKILHTTERFFVEQCVECSSKIEKEL